LRSSVPVAYSCSPSFFPFPGFGFGGTTSGVFRAVVFGRVPCARFWVVVVCFFFRWNLSFSKPPLFPGAISSASSASAFLRLRPALETLAMGASAGLATSISPLFFPVTPSERRLPGLSSRGGVSYFIGETFLVPCLPLDKPNSPPPRMSLPRNPQDLRTSLMCERSCS